MNDNVSGEHGVIESLFTEVAIANKLRMLSH